MTENAEKAAGQLLDNAPCGYLQIDRNGAVLRMNNTLRRWLGYEADEEIGPCLVEDLFSVGGKIYCQTHLLPLLQIQGEVSEINLTMIAKNAVRFPTLVNAKKDADETSEEQTFSVFIVDITQRKNYERELLKERQKAENAVQKLKQANNDLEQFAHIASHDLQGPLRTISGLISLMEKKKIIEPGFEAQKLFSLIKSNSSRMNLMVRNLLEYSKVDDNQSDFSPVSIEDICQQALELLREDVEKSQAIVNISEMPVIAGSKPQLIRLFQNLFENSIKYRSEKPLVIDITLNTTDDFYHIQVKDNGIGFEMEYATKVFSFMKRLHSNDDIPGTGIGLTGCKRIMRNHQGSINVESEPGKGSVFKLQFPRK